MLVSVARSSMFIARTAAPPNSKTRPTPAPARMSGSASRCSTRSFALTPGGSRAVDLDAQHLGHGKAHRAGHEGIGHLGGADTEGDAAQRAAVRRVRIGADDQLARQRVALGHQRVRDALRTFALGLQPVVDQAVCRDEFAVRLGQPAHAADQAARDVHGAALDIGVVVLEADDAAGIVQCVAWAEALPQQLRAHAGVDLVDEAPVGAHEAGLQCMAFDDLLEQRLRSR